MTNLDKPISRVTSRQVDSGRQAVVTLEPGDTIAFRLKGCRYTVRTTLAACYSLAVKTEMQANNDHSM